MAKGGKRPGAGRPKAPHTIQTEAAKAALIAAFVKEQTVIFKVLLEKVKSGDVPAIRELFDRVWGKSVQPIDGDGQGGAITMKVVNYGNNDTLQLHTTPLPITTTTSD